MSDAMISLSAEDFGSENAVTLDTILANSHPLMVEAFYLAAVPKWYNVSLLQAIRNQDDGREEGLITRLEQYSFVSALGQQAGLEPAYCVRPEERSLLQNRWIAEDPQAYRDAHNRALNFWETHPDPNSFAQAQNCLYHQFFVDHNVAIRDLITLFRTYTNDRQLPATERLLSTAGEACTYLALLDPDLTSGLDNLITYLKARLAQLRGQWESSLALLDSLESASAQDLPAYVARAYGYALVADGNYVEAIQKFTEALALFDRQGITFIDPQNMENDRAYTLIALGDAYVGLAISVRGRLDQKQPRATFQHYLSDFSTLFSSLPLVFYLTPTLGWRVWHPRFWPVLRDLDWIVARLFVNGVRYYREADRLLEKYGTPDEGVVADERLARLALALGDAEQAEQLFLRLSAEVEAPLSDYHQATVSVGLGETYLQMHSSRYALKPLREALPVLATYEDRELEVRARDLLGRALLDMGEPAEALPHLAAAQDRYQAKEMWTEATRLTEYVEIWEQQQPKKVADPVRTRVKALVDNLQKRQYIGVFQHRLPIYFRRFVLVVLPVVLMIAQLLTITVETGSGLMPEIHFQPAPLLSPDQAVKTNLNLGVAAAHITVLDATDVVLLWAIGLFVGYLLISLLSGLAIILFTKPRTVQARGRAATVCFGPQAITVGRANAARTLRWAEISRFVKANVCLWARPIRNSSAFGLESAQGCLVVRGNTSRYAHVRAQVAQLVAPAARVVNLDYAIARSKMGLLFVLNLVAIGLFDLLAQVAPAVLFKRILGTIYSLADLYPYLFLGAVIAWLWWVVVQPVRQRVRLWPRRHFVLWILGLGLLLTLIQILLRFRPLLTVVNVYPPLIAIVMLASAGIAMWYARVAGQRLYPLYVRVGTAIVALLACGLLLTVMGRDVSAYHHLVAGHALRDQALNDDVAIRADYVIESALDAYKRASEMGSRKVWGIDPRSAARIPFGIPAPDTFTWLSALTSQASAQVRLGRYDDAIRNYTQALTYLDSSDRIYAWRALALQGVTPMAVAQSTVAVDGLSYERAIADLNKAIELNPDKVVYFLWRGAAQQALWRFDDALYSYDHALQCEAGHRTICLTDVQREHALTGKGWTNYVRSDYQEALDLFRQAKEVNSESASAWVGEGYALYALGYYEDILPIWKKASELDPKDATILISLGTLYWKFGKESETLHRDRCEDYRQSVDYFVQATDRANLHPQLDEDVAYTYRSRAQVLYLLSAAHCSDSDVEMLKQAVASYSEAIQLDPGNAFYWQMRGRLIYPLWVKLDKQSGGTDPALVDWVLRGMDDLEKAIELDPVDDHDRDYIPQAFKWNFMLPLLKSGLPALLEGDIAGAVACYGRGLDPEAATVDTAAKLAMIAMTRDDVPEAARRFNDVVRYVAVDSKQYAYITILRDHLQALWAIKSVTGNALLVEMEAQLPAQLEMYPDLKSNGYFWRYRAWFKYHVGLSAFRLGAEADAEALLQSGKADAKRASGLSGEHAAVFTYLDESAWGWYHLERGNDYAAQARFLAALADYEAAFTLITPRLNPDAPAEKTQAAFSAGLTALRLGQPERAAQWYDKAIALLEAYKANTGVQGALVPAIDALKSLLEENPALEADGKPILEKLEALR
ncbi:MAG: tetratricopeptide repeat protein [Anaerolineae bacterium]|nr:tetratricopeptide repeat protein [Anaerolineae bacterium]